MVHHLYEDVFFAVYVYKCLRILVSFLVLPEAKTCGYFTRWATRRHSNSVSMFPHHRKVYSGVAASLVRRVSSKHLESEHVFQAHIIESPHR